ncbi:hypothetical protein K9L67_05050 [Candidatus Woesearchaeota archaeon]|nr:hypothetical protein [Candidatus Woesearchaeota archaeon]MCF8013323.1 hypothetical protein [Candidatus Woesearchaeota archaeon]
MKETNHFKEAATIITVTIVLILLLIFGNSLGITGLVTSNTTINETQIDLTPTNQTNTTTENTTTIPNNPPTQTTTIQNIKIQNKTIEINLNNYFKDPENQTLYYDLNNLNNVNATINESTLTIQPNTNTGTLQIYASDEENTITSNEFNISKNTTINETQKNTTNQTTNTTTNTTTQITNETQTNATNQTTENTTSNEPIETTPTQEPNTITNETINETQIDLTPTNQTNTTKNNTINISQTTDINLTDPCQNSNPNMIPFECIAQNPQQYIDDSGINIDNIKGKIVGRITQVGNLIIEGELIENSNINPQKDDYKIVNIGQFYEETPIAYINTQTGNFHIKGKLYEEDFFMQPTKGAYIFQNIRGVNLAYIDTKTGDLHLKSNLIIQRQTTK